MADYRDHHATLFLPPWVTEPVEAVRRARDPAMATQIAAHVTLVHPREAPTLNLLVARLRATSAAVAPFRLRLGALSCFGRPEEGVYIGVEDTDGTFRRIREDLLRPQFRPVAFPPHVTLVHPRTSSRGREFWERGGYQVGQVEFTVGEVGITAFDGTTWTTMETLPLGQGRS